LNQDNHKFTKQQLGNACDSSVLKPQQGGSIISGKMNKEFFFENAEGKTWT
jgi:DNA-binding protein H-NS